jgi:predicted RNase H-like HicB family nuclease
MKHQPHLEVGPGGIRGRFSVDIIAEAGGYVARCHELGLAAQGDTSSEAVAALKEAIALFLKDVQDRGVLEKALDELGWKRAKGDGHGKRPVEKFLLPLVGTRKLTVGPIAVSA